MNNRRVVRLRPQSKDVARACADLTHYVPCHLADDADPVSFSIGPVTFHQYSSICGARRARSASLPQSESRTCRPGLGEPTDRREIAEICMVL